MSAVTIQQMADRVAQLMEERLGVHGRGLPGKVTRGGNRLPRRVRDAANALAKAAVKSRNPKLLKEIEIKGVTEAYDICVRHLAAIDPGQRRRKFVGGVLSSAGFALLVSGLLVIGYLVWRGYL